MKRSEMIAAMQDRSTPWDVIVIGGGATGLGAAVESASRGHRTVLVEAQDFSQGTSSRSTKLIHGGVRYLKQGRLRMVRRSLTERQRLLRNASHVVHTLDFVVPAYQFGSQAFYFAGLRMYDLLAGNFLQGRSRCLSREQTLQRLTTLKDTGLRGGVLYSDGQFDDSRLAVTLAQTAADCGAIVANYVRVTRLLHRNGRVSGLVAVDQESGAEIELAGKVVINATGVFVENILGMDEGSAASHAGAPRVSPSQGTHLVLNAEFLPGCTALMIPETDDGRVLFAIPWHGKVLVGTTDIPVPRISDDPRPSKEEVDYLLEHAGRYLTRQPAVRDIRACFSGLRPLVRESQSEGSTAALSREHLIHMSGTGLISVIGGKWTTYRQMGEELIDRAESTGSLSRQKSVSAELRLHGCPVNDADLSGVARTRYGTDERHVQELISARPELGQTLHPELTIRGADVVWAIRVEMARTIEDVLARRHRAMFLDRQAAVETAPAVADLLRAETGRPETQVSQDLQAFLGRWQPSLGQRPEF